MGRVSFRAVGAAMIAVSALGCDAGSVDVIVDDMPSQIVISIDGSAPAGDTLELAVGQTARLSGEALNEIGDVVGDAEVVWASSNPSVASIDGSGVVTALAPGETDLSASAGGVDRVLPTLVREAAPHFLEVSPASVNLYGVGSSIQVAVIGRDELGNVISSGGVTWESLNPSVATVSSTGLVTAQGIGTTLLVIAAACCDSVEVPVSVSTEEEPTGDVVFRSDWSTSVGTNATAVMDGGAWDEWYCGEFAGGEPRGVLEVVRGSSFDWTLTPNVLQVTMDGEQCGQLEESRRVPDGVDYYIRAYIMVMDALNNTNNHPYKTSFSGSQGAMLWAIRDPTGAGGTYRPAIRTIPQQWTDPDVNQTYAIQYTGPVLNQGDWYRFEHMIEYVGDPALGHTRVWPRIYNAANELIADEHDFYWAEAGKTLAESYADGAVRQHSPVDGSVFNAITHLNLGYEGPAGSSPGNERYFFGGVEVRTGGWPGPLQPQ